MCSAVFVCLMLISKTFYKGHGPKKNWLVFGADNAAMWPFIKLLNCEVFKFKMPWSNMYVSIFLFLVCCCCFSFVLGFFLQRILLSILCNFSKLSNMSGLFDNIAIIIELISYQVFIRCSFNQIYKIYKQIS